MDSHQPGAKRDISDVNQNQNMSDLSEESEDGVKIKRLKLEMDPLRMGSILEIIFSFLDVPSIKTARQVTKLWSVEGVKMLFIKCYVKIPLGLRTGKTSSRFKEMEQFKTFLSYKSNDVSMIPNISLDDDDDIELWKMLGVFGNQVNSLNINILCDRPKFFQDLLDLLPNLKYLNFGVHLDHDEFRSFFAVMSKATGRSPLVISRVELTADKMKELKEIEKYSKCENIKIEELNIEVQPSNFKDEPQFEARFANAINKLLLSQNHLKKVTLPSCEIFLHLLDFPIMARIISIKLNFLSPSGHFPLPFRFSEKVPNLQEVLIDVEEPNVPSDEFFENLFQNTGGQAPSVKRVKYSGMSQDLSVEPLFKIFPNVEDFEMCVTQISKRMFSSLWKQGTKLKKILLDFNMDRFIGNFDELDSVFTGLSDRTMKKIKKSSKLPFYTAKELEKLRVNPSVLDLKELEELAIHFEGDAVVDELPERMLAVAGEYAFRFMPEKSKIFIFVGDFNQGLFDCRGLENFQEVFQVPNVNAKFEEDETDESDDDSY